MFQFIVQRSPSEWSVCAGAASDSCGKSGEGHVGWGKSGGKYILILQRFFRYGQKLHRGALLRCKPFVGILIQRLSVTILHLPPQEISVTTPNQLQAHGRSSLIGTIWRKKSKEIISVCGSFGGNSGKLVPIGCDCMVDVRNVWFLEFQNIFRDCHTISLAALCCICLSAFFDRFPNCTILPFCQWDVIVCCFSIGNAFLQRLRLQFSAKLPFEGTSLKSFQPSTLLLDLLGWYKKGN